MKKLMGLALVGLLAMTFASTASAFMPKVRGGFEVFQGQPDTKGQSWRFRLVANNGQIVLQSEAYAQRAGALNGVESIKSTGVLTAAVLKAANGQSYFNVRALNFQITGSSETYKTASNAKRALGAVQALIIWVNQYKIPTRG